MEQFAAGVVTTLTVGVRLIWVTKSVPAVGTAREALVSATEAHTKEAQIGVERRASSGVPTYPRSLWRPGLGAPWGRP